MPKLAILAAILIAFAGAAGAQTAPSPAASPPPPAALWRADRPRAGAKGDRRCGRRGDEARLDDERRSDRFRHEPRRLRAYGWGQLASIVIAEHQARTAAPFRRPTRAFEEATRNGAAMLSLDGVIASIGAERDSSRRSVFFVLKINLCDSANGSDPAAGAYSQRPRHRGKRDPDRG